MKVLLQILFLMSVFVQAPLALGAEVPTHTSHTLGTIKSTILSKNYRELGKLLRQELGKKISIRQVKQIAYHSQSIPLKRALCAATTLQALHLRGLSYPQILQLALFIEAELPSYIEKENFYVSKSDTGLACSIEYDPITHYRFIHLDGKPGSYLGHGWNKTVTKSILYDLRYPEVLARCQIRNQETASFTSESEMLKQFQGEKGIVALRAHTEYSEKGVSYGSIFLTLYNSNSLARSVKSKNIFDLRQKVHIMHNLINGLESMHKKNIVHRDLKPGNYLINISKHNKNKIKAVIADLGTAKYTFQAQGISPQARAQYRAPEVVFEERLKGSDYFATDVFAMGCFFYYLYFEKKPEWQNKAYVAYACSLGSNEFKYQKLSSFINKYRQKRRQYMPAKGKRNCIEQLILQMVDPDPSKRGTATQLRSIIESIDK
ncbi:MAG: hypothetical protein JWO53_213 [Chlamydiia bacterium]|nr:hypothetical protein [Chlamydiia bacterium]